MWQAIAGAVGNFISQGSGTLASIWQNSKDRQHDWSTWNAQNFYNSPAEQMIRLKNAGLNPNLVYGSGTSTLASPVPQSASHGFSGIDNPMKAYYDLKQQDAMTQQIKANVSLANAQKKYVDAQTKALGLENNENESNDTSRSTPYPVKIVKQAGTSVGKVFKPVVSPEGHGRFDSFDDVVSGRRNKHLPKGNLFDRLDYIFTGRQGGY